MIAEAAVVDACLGRLRRRGFLIGRKWRQGVQICGRGGIAPFGSVKFVGILFSLEFDLEFAFASTLNPKLTRQNPVHYNAQIP